MAGAIPAAGLTLNGGALDVASVSTNTLAAVTLTDGEVFSSSLTSYLLNATTHTLVNGYVALNLGGSNGVTKSGLGTVTLAASVSGGNYSYTSSLNILGGAVFLPTSTTGLGTTTNGIGLNGGALVSGHTSYASFSSGRTVTFGASTTNVINAGTAGVLTFTANIVGTADGGFNKTGTSTFSFLNGVTGGNNTYSGPTTVWTGELRAPLSTTATQTLGLPAASRLVLAGGVLSINNVASPQQFTRTLGTAAGQVAWAANADGGFSAFTGGATVNIGGSATADTLAWGVTPNFIQSGRVLILGGQLATTALSVQNPIDLAGGTRIIATPLGAGTESATLAGSLLDSVGGAALVKAGGGQLAVTGTPGYTGATTIAGGALQLGVLPAGNTNFAGGVLQYTGGGTITPALGTGPGQFQWTAGGGFGASGTGLTLNVGGAAATLVWGSTPFFVPAGSPLVFGSQLGTSAVTVANPIDLNAAPRTVAVNGGTTTAQLTNGSLTKTGAGTLALAAGSALDAAGTLTVSAGTLALGTVPISVANADLAGGLTGTLTVANAITLRDSGLILSGVLAGPAGVTKVGSATTQLSGASTYTGTTTVSGTGRITMTSGSILGTSALIANGTLPSSTGSISGATYPTFGGSFSFVNTAGGTERVNTPATGSGTLPVTLNGGSLIVAGNATATAIVQNFAGLTLGAGSAGVFAATSTSVAGQTVTLNFNPAAGNGLTSNPGSVLLVAGPALGTTTKVAFAGTLPASGTGSLVGGGTAGTTSVPVLSGVFGENAATATTGVGTTFTFPAAGTGMVTYDANGVRLLNTGTEYSTNATAPASGVNLAITASTALTAAAATTYNVNSLLVTGNTTSAVVFGQGATATTLAVASGNVLVSGGTNTATSTAPVLGASGSAVAFVVAFSGVQGNVVVGNGTSASATSPAPLRVNMFGTFTGTNGFVKSGPGILSWTPNSASAAFGSITGGSFYLNGGMLSFGAFTSTIGNTLPLVFNGGTLQYTASGTGVPTLANTSSSPVTLGAAGGTYDTQQSGTGGGSGGAGGGFTLLQVPSAVVVWNGLFSGPGALTKTGVGGGMILQNDNTYSGGTVLAGGYLVIPTVNSLLTGLLGTNPASASPIGTGPLTLTTGTLMVAGSTSVAGGNDYTVANAVNLNGESTFSYVGPTGAATGYTPFTAALAVPARLTFSGPMTLSNGFGHTFTNNNPVSVNGYSLVLGGAIGETIGGSNLTFLGIGTSMQAAANPLYTPVMSVPTSLTNISITGVNTYTGQTTIRMGIVNPNASVLAGQSGPLGNSYLPVILGDPGGGTFAGLLLAGDNLTVSRNLQLEIAGSGGAAPPAVAPVYLGTLPGNLGGTISGNIQLANRTLVLFSGGGSLAAPTTFSGVVSDSGGVVAGNIGTFTTTVSAISGANLYAGGTAVTAGTLLVNNTSGSGTGTGAVSVSAGANLGGRGTIAGSVAVAGTITPGTALATPTLTVGGATFAATASLGITLFGTGPTDIGLLNVTGPTAVGVSPASSVRLDLSAVDADTLRAAVGSGNTRTYTVVQTASGVGTFTPANLSFTGLGNFNPTEWTLSGTANTTQLNFTPQAVPEPATALLAATLGGLALRWRRRRSV